MGRLCAQCNERLELKELQEQAGEFDEAIKGRLGTDYRGGSVFLGQHYGHSKYMLFTLNPGVPKPSTPSAKLDLPNDGHWCAGLYCRNYHWEGPPDAWWRTEKNWRGAYHLFSRMAKEAPDCQRSLACMTDQFIIPWRTRNGKELMQSRLWPHIRSYSVQLCNLSFQHHRPAVIFASGKDTLSLLLDFLGFSNSRPTESTGSKQFDRCEWFSLNLPSYHALSIFRVPHTSRYSHSGLASVAKWIAERLPPT